MADKEELASWAAALVEALRADPNVEEGVVRTSGPPSYRRLEFRGVSFAYVRLRPRWQMVRVDVLRGWPVLESPLAEPWSSGEGCLTISSESELREATAFLLEMVRRRGAESKL